MADYLDALAWAMWGLLGVYLLFWPKLSEPWRLTGWGVLFWVAMRCVMWALA